MVNREKRERLRRVLLRHVLLVVAHLVLSPWGYLGEARRAYLDAVAVRHYGLLGSNVLLDVGVPGELDLAHIEDELLRVLSPSFAAL